MGTVRDIDEAAANLLSHPDQAYEAAVFVAVAAQRYLEDPTCGTVAADIRDAFGTWAERIHWHGSVDGSTLGQAEAAHCDIKGALIDWRDAGRSDISGFALRWKDRARDVDITWM